MLRLLHGEENTQLFCRHVFVKATNVNEFVDIRFSGTEKKISTSWFSQLQNNNTSPVDGREKCEVIPSCNPNQSLIFVEQIWIICLDEWVFSDCNMELTRRPHGKLRFTCFWDHWRGLEMNVRHQEMKSPSIDRIAERQTVSMITCTKVFELLTVRYI